MSIHPTALVADTAILADDIEVGAYSIIGDAVEIGRGCRIDSHVVINGPTKIGDDNHIYQFCSVGDDPQDKKYANEPTRLEIGDGNTIREFCTISRGTTQDQGVTWVKGTLTSNLLVDLCDRELVNADLAVCLFKNRLVFCYR